MYSRRFNRNNLLAFVTCSFVAVFFLTYNLNIYLTKLRPSIITHKTWWGHVSRCFSEEVAEFIETARNESLQLIIVEPYLLNKLLTDEERTILINHKLMPNVSNCVVDGGIHLFTFGVRSKTLLKLEDDHLCRLSFNSHGFSCVAAVGEDNGRRKWPTNQSPTGNVTTHYFFLKNKALIHLVILFERSEHITWVGLMPKDVRPFDIDFKCALRFGSTEQIFDLIVYEQTTLCNVTIHVPRESGHFLSQMDSSELLECSFSEAGKFQKKVKRQQKLASLYTKGIVGKSTEALIKMKNLAKELQIPFWLASGTLLGWYRECDIVPYTTDMDFATWSQFAKKDIIARLTKNNHGLKAKFTYGFPENGFEMAFHSGYKFKLDLFFIYENKDNFTIAGHMPWMASYCYYSYFKYKLCSAELLGHKVLVPCNPEQTLISEYGSNWTEPMADWHYYSSPLNRGPLIKWPKGTKGYFRNL